MKIKQLFIQFAYNKQRTYMKVEQCLYPNGGKWTTIRGGDVGPAKYQLVHAFGSTHLLSDPAIFNHIRDRYPNAQVVINSTAGEIIDTQVNDDSIALTAIYFEKTAIATACINVAAVSGSFEAGVVLAGKIDHAGLVNVLVISDGQMVNGSDLVSGLQQSFPPGTIITGGLAGDGSRFERTLVGLNEQPGEGNIVLVGFYGNDLRVTYGSVGGWDAFGPERLITRSENNVLYELDGKPALEIYKMYLGDYATELPGSGLLFPLSIRTAGASHSIVRTILGVNEDERSLTFAGNMPRGEYAQLMRANFDRLIDGASHAAAASAQGAEQMPDLAILISCVGRKLVLDQRIEEEIEVVRAIYGDKTAITGFYSYGEISPSFNFMKCELHNQTMTITTFTEL